MMQEMLDTIHFLIQRLTFEMLDRGYSQRDIDAILLSSKNTAERVENELTKNNKK